MKYKKSDEAAFLYVSERAEAKMCLLVRDFSTEVAWHGIARKTGKGEYHLDDIIVYPQTVTGGNVSTDTEDLAAWAESLSEERYNAIHLQGHSHVNFSCRPSTTDKRDQLNYINELSGSDFYIFLILNKSGECYAMIVDAEDHLVYPNKCIAVMTQIGLFNFLKDAHDLAVPYKPSYLETIEAEYLQEKEECESGLHEIS